MKGLIKSTVNSVSRLFSKDEAEEEHVEAETASPPAPPKKPRREKARIDPAETLAVMEKTLERIVAKHGTAVAGRVQLLRFDELLASVGPKRGERLSQAIEGIVRKYIGPSDVLRTMGTGVFLTIFSGISKEEAEAKCAMIRDDVNKFAEGDPNLEGKLEVSTVTVAVDGKAGLDELASMEKVFERLEAVQMAPDVVAADAAPPSPDPQPRENDDDQVSANDLEDWDEWLGSIPEGVKPVMPPGETGEPDRTDYDDPKWRDISYDGPGLALSTGDNATPVDVNELRRQFQDARVLPRPVWDMDRKTMPAVSCIPIKPGQSVLAGDAVVGPNPGGVVTLSLDRLGIQWARGRLAAQGTETKGPLLVVPLHFASLATMRNRSLLFNALLELGPSARPWIMGEVSFPKDIHASAVEDVIRLLAPFVGQVGVNCGLEWRMFSNLKVWGARWAGFSIAADDQDEAKTVDDMANFAAGATGAGLVPYAKDLPSRNLVMAAPAVGIRHVFSAPDPDISGDLRNMQFRLKDLYPKD